MAPSFGQPLEASISGNAAASDPMAAVSEPISGKNVGAVSVGGLLCQQRMLEGDQHAQIASRWIDASDEGDEQNRRDGLRCREYEARESDQSGTGEKKASQLVTRGDEPDNQCHRRRSKQRGARDDSNLLR
jgi:hypothetical protein